MVDSHFDPDWGRRSDQLMIEEFPDGYWYDAYEFALRLPRHGYILAPEKLNYDCVRMYFSQDNLDGIDVIILHKDYITSLRQSFLKQLMHFTCEFENPVFYVLKRTLEREYRHVEDIVATLCASIPRLGFVHLPKTAGTSIFASLRKVAAGSQYFGTNDEFLTHEGLEQYSVVGGHFKLCSLLARAPSIKNVFTVIRDPNDRLLSAVAHARRELSPKVLGPRMTAMRNLSLDDFLQSKYGQGEIHKQSFTLCPIETRFNEYSMKDNLTSLKHLISSKNLRVFSCTSIGALEDYIERTFGKRVEVGVLNTTTEKSQFFSDSERQFVESDEFRRLFVDEKAFLQSLWNFSEHSHN